MENPEKRHYSMDLLSKEEHTKVEEFVKQWNNEHTEHQIICDVISHANEALITFNKGLEKEKTIHLTRSGDLTHHFTDAIKATIMYPELTLEQGMEKLPKKKESKKH